jgi:hypothetical protein
MTPEPLPAITAQIGSATLTIQIGSTRHWAYMTLFTKSGVDDGAYFPPESVSFMLTKTEATKLRDCLNTLIDNLPG